MTIVQQIRDSGANPSLTLEGIVLTMFDARANLAQQVVGDVRSYFSEIVYQTLIPRTIRLGEAPSFGRPVIHHDPRSAGAEAYFELAKEVAARG